MIISCFTPIRLYLKKKHDIKEGNDGENQPEVDFVDFGICVFAHNFGR
jgi:hypothetical protein